MDFLKTVVSFIYAVLASSVGAIFGALACIGQVSAEYTIACAQVLLTHPGELPERRRVFTPPGDDDPAKPNYFYGPARSDLRYIRQLTRSRWEGAAEWWQRRVGGLWDTGSASRALTGPLAAGLTVGLIVALPIAALLMALVWLTHEMLIGVATVSVRGTAAILRAVDSGLLAARHIQVRCIACFERIPYPAYVCDKCRKIHWDIRPGKYGVLRRTCECGRRMPTLLVLRTAKQLDAICPRRGCRHPLEYRPGEAQEIVLPIFGSTGAGKTLLLYGIITMLQQSVRPGIHVEYADSATAERMGDLTSALAEGSALPATPIVLPTAYVLRLRVGRYHRIVQLLDTAGERFYDSQRSADLIYLGVANTFILVIDPLSVSTFWESLPSPQRDRLAPYRSAARHPQLAYQQTADRIAEMGRHGSRRRLGVVFSRADLLGTECGPGAGEGEEIQKWAIADLGLGGLLRDAGSDFKELAFFHTAPFGSNENTLTALIHWIMRAEGIPPTG